MADLPLVIPSNPATAGLLRYVVDLPDDLDYRRVIVGALSLAADPDAYVKSDDGSDEDRLLDALNLASKAIESLELASIVTDPIGTIKIHGFRTLSDVPDNWIECRGQAVLEADYPDLFGASRLVTRVAQNLIMPNFTGRYPRGVSNSAFLGLTGGSDSVSLSPSNHAPHTHPVNGFGQGIVTIGTGAPVTVITPGTFTFPTGSQGSGTPFNVTNPFINVQYWMIGRDP